VAEINKSNLPDDLFLALSAQGRACANKAARILPVTRPDALVGIHLIGKSRYV